MTDAPGVVVPIEGIAHGGEGVGRLPDGRAVFTHRTSPGDVARVRVTRSQSRWARGRLERLVEAGPARRAAPCPLYDRCGGCTLQHLKYEEQLAWKGRIVHDALARIGGVRVSVAPAVPSPELLGYRTRMTFTLRRLGGGRVVAGLYELDSPGRVTDVAGECLVASPAVLRAWTGLREAWGGEAARLPAGKQLRLTLREVNEGVLLHVTGGYGEMDGLALLEAVRELAAVWWDDGTGARLVAGTQRTTETWLDRTYAPGPTAFIQVNRRAGERLHRRVLELAESFPGRVVDAYAGVAPLGRALAADGRPVVSIESDPEAAAAARQGAPDGLEVLTGAVEEEIGHALPADLVIANPPRGGLDPAVPRALLEQPPSAMLYVSCDPATLARDVARLGAVFRVSGVEAFDLFPQTAHVEALATLERSSRGG